MYRNRRLRSHRVGRDGMGQRSQYHYLRGLKMDACYLEVRHGPPQRKGSRRRSEGRARLTEYLVADLSDAPSRRLNIGEGG